jgi:hypothetical protein
MFVDPMLLYWGLQQGHKQRQGMYPVYVILIIFIYMKHLLGIGRFLSIIQISWAQNTPVLPGRLRIPEHRGGPHAQGAAGLQGPVFKSSAERWHKLIK